MYIPCKPKTQKYVYEGLQYNKDKGGLKNISNWGVQVKKDHLIVYLCNTTAVFFFKSNYKDYINTNINSF